MGSWEATGDFIDPRFERRGNGRHVLIYSVETSRGTEWDLRLDDGFSQAYPSASAARVAADRYIEQGTLPSQHPRFRLGGGTYRRRWRWLRARSRRSRRVGR